MLVLCGKHFVLDLTNVHPSEMSEARALTKLNRTRRLVVTRVTTTKCVYSMGCFTPPPGLFENDGTPVVVRAEY